MIKNGCVSEFGIEYRNAFKGQRFLSLMPGGLSFLLPRPYEILIKEVTETTGDKTRLIFWRDWSWQITNVEGGDSNVGFGRGRLKRVYYNEGELVKDIAALPQIEELSFSFYDASIGPYPHRYV